MRIATLAEAVQSLSRTRQSAILMVTADPHCGNSAFGSLDFLPEEAIAVLMNTGAVIVGAESSSEYVRLRDMGRKFEDAFEHQTRLAGEAILFQAGTLVYRLVCDGVTPSMVD